MGSPMFRQLRAAEIADSIALLRRYKPSGDVLEIGAGTGWQSAALNAAGYRVQAIDLPGTNEISNHARSREWDIRDYDGSHIPLPDQSVDVIYSSNVLEHVEDLETLTAEMRRVLRPGGVALHLLPNRLWRALSLATYYPAQVIDGARWLVNGRQASGASSASPSPPPAPKRLLKKAVGRLMPHAHGARGSAISELQLFSKSSWDRYFHGSGWDVLYYGDNGILASGDYILGRWLPLWVRRQIGRFLGGIAHVYVVRSSAG